MMGAHIPPLPQYMLDFKVKIKWEKWFAWYPVKVHGVTTWLKFVYRYKVVKIRMDMDVYWEYEYGTIFDVISNA